MGQVIGGHLIIHGRLLDVEIFFNEQDAKEEPFLPHCRLLSVFFGGVQSSMRALEDDANNHPLIGLTGLKCLPIYAQSHARLGTDDFFSVRAIILEEVEDSENCVFRRVGYLGPVPWRSWPNMRLEGFGADILSSQMGMEGTTSS